MKSEITSKVPAELRPHFLQLNLRCPQQSVDSLFSGYKTFKAFSMADTVQNILQELEALGSESTKRTLMRHGAREPFFGVRIGDMKPIEKRLKRNYALSLALYETGNSDAMYLAGLIADEKSMTVADLQHWAENASWQMISEYTVAWVAAESNHGYKLGMKWIDDSREKIATSGWATLSGLLAMHGEAAFEKGDVAALLDRIVKTLHQSPDRVRYTMNNFVIAAGTYVPELRAKAIGVAHGLGKVEVNMGGTACQVPEAAGYIEKAAARWNGKYRKMVRC